MVPSSCLIDHARQDEAMTSEADAVRLARRAELAANLVDVHERIARACTAAGRSPSDVTLVAVTKTHPAHDIALLAELGITHVGESRVQEGASKHAELGASTSLRWHMIGQLQRNKIKSLVQWADVVESVDRTALVAPLGRAATERGDVLDVLVQFDLADVEQPGRGGVWPAAAPELVAAIAAEGSLRLAGVMAVAPLGVDPTQAFARLATMHEAITRDFPDAVIMSAGMSSDLEQAIAAGATHVRVGTALLGSRPPVGYGA
jgi:pyridoxal phosphate enzyme (YggS family)